MRKTGDINIWLCLLFCLAIFCPAMADAHQGSAPQTEPLLKAQAWWRDMSGKAGFDEARVQHYSPYEGLFSKGFSPAVDWIRLRIAPSEIPLRLLLTPPWIDQLTLFDPATGAQPRTLGDHYPADGRFFHGIGLGFELAPYPEPRDVWLRLASTSTHLLFAELVPVGTTGWAMVSYIVEPAIYVTVLLLIFLILLASWWQHRDKVIRAYLVRNLAVTYYICGYFGLPTLWFSDWLPPLFFDKAFSVSVLLLLPLAIRFDVQLLASYRPNPWLFGLVRYLPWASIALLVFFALGYEHQALQFNSLLLLVFTLLIFSTVLSARPPEEVEQLVSKRLLIGYYFIATGGLFIGLIGLTGVLPAQPWTMKTLIWHNLVTAVLMTVLLFVRSQRWAMRSERLQWELKQMQHELGLEQRRREEQSTFLYMLMHELKTPLSVVTLTLGSGLNEARLGQAKGAARDMKAILERCLQADQLGDQPLQLKPRSFEITDLVWQVVETLPGLGARLRLQAEAIRVQTDPQLLAIVLGNLLSNAMRYSEPASSIELRIKPHSEAGQAGLLLHLSNRPGSAGWPDATRLFDKYYRAPGAYDLSGSGLGLPLALQLAQNLGGQLRYCPTDTHIGFALWLPQSSI